MFERVKFVENEVERWFTDHSSAVIYPWAIWRIQSIWKNQEIEEKCRNLNISYIDYNAATKCVRLSDQMSIYHTALRKTKWRRNAIHLLYFMVSPVESLKNSTLQKFCLTHVTLGQEMGNKCTFQKKLLDPCKSLQVRMLCYDTLAQSAGSKKATLLSALLVDGKPSFVYSVSMSNI